MKFIIKEIQIDKEIRNNIVSQENKIDAEMKIQKNPYSNHNTFSDEMLQSHSNLTKKSRQRRTESVRKK